MAINIKINQKTDDQLTALKAKRKEEMGLPNKKIDINAEAVDLLYKKVFKK